MHAAPPRGRCGSGLAARRLVRLAGRAGLILGCVIVATAAALPAPARAQSATLAMTADRTQLAVGGSLRLQVRADVTGGDANGLQLPDLSAFRVTGRRVVRPMQFSFGFSGQQQVFSSSIVYDITLQATRAGTFTLKPAKLRVGGRDYESNPLTVVVTGGPGAPGAPPAPGGPGPPASAPPGDPSPPAGQLDGATFDQQAFLRTVTSTDHPHVGEQVTITVYLYARSGLRSSPVITREPSTDGFWIHDLLPPTRSLDASRQIVGGLPFNVYVLRRLAAFPLRAGPQVIGPMALQFESGSLFDLFGNGGRTLTREGVAVPIEVLPLPEAGRPDGPVAVGRWQVEARVDRSQVATGDAVTLTVLVRGTGNVRDVQLTLPPIDGLRALAPQIRDEVTAPGDLVGGTRTWEWLLVPERPGTFRIPAFVLSTFDPQSVAYRTIRSAPLSITAAGNAITASSAAAGDDTPGGVNATAGTDADAPHFGAVRTHAELSRATTPVSRRGWYAWALAAPPACWALVLLLNMLRRRASARSAAAAPRRTLQRARRRLSKAQERAGEGDPGAFYGEIRTVLSDVLEARLGKPVGGMTHAQLRRHLVELGMEDDLARRVVDEIEGSEFARFSSAGASSEEMQSCGRRAVALVQRLDRFTPERAEDEP